MPILIPIGPQPPITPEQARLIDTYLMPLISYLQRLEVYDELAMVDGENARVMRFGYPNWRNDLRFEIRKTGDVGGVARNVTLTSGIDYVTDFTNGLVTLNTPLAVGDEIRATYHFQYFTRAEMAAFLTLCLFETNGRKPISAYNLENMPLEWDATIVMGAYWHCLERVLLDTGIWRTYLVFVNTNEYRSYLKELLTASKVEYEANIKALKRRAIAMRPFGVSSGKYFTMQQVDNINFRAFTIIGASS